MARASNAWLRYQRPGASPRLRVVCLPHAGGAASFYRGWRQRFPADVEFVAVQYPGREDRVDEPRIEDMTRLATLIAGVLDVFIDRPLALFGHSMGAAVAYEVAWRLEQRGWPALAGLFVSGRAAPGARAGGTKHLGDDDTLWDEVRRLGGTDASVLGEATIRALVLPVLRSDYRVSETYQPQPGRLLACPVTAFAGDTDPEVTVDEMRRWAGLTQGAFDLRVFPGQHFYLVAEQAAVVAALLEGLCASVEREPSRRRPR